MSDEVTGNITEVMYFVVTLAVIISLAILFGAIYAWERSKRK